MAGCDKADRNRKSKSGIAYKASNRREINKVRKMKRAGQNPDKRPVPDYKPKKEAADVLKNGDIFTNHQRYAHIYPLYWVNKCGVALDVTPHYGEAHLLARAKGGNVVVYNRV